MSRIGQFFKSLFTRPNVTIQSYISELEALLIDADFSPSLAASVVKSLRSYVDKSPTSSLDDVKRWLFQHLKSLYVSAVKSSPVPLHSPLHVVLIVGVNGAGKTTSCAKLAHYYHHQSPVLVAGDTFRAGAVQQLKLWGERLQLPVVAIEGAKDPSSVVFEGMEVALKNHHHVIIIDTAGRLQTKDNLMAELAKLKRVIQKKVSDAPHETLLVIDASLGQNVIQQALVFNQSTPLTGLVLSKLDGISKGGIVWTIAQQLHVGVQWIGNGEKVTDWQSFDIDTHIHRLFDEESEQ